MYRCAICGAAHLQVFLLFRSRWGRGIKILSLLPSRPCGASQGLTSHARNGEERNPIGILANRSMTRRAAAVFPQSVRRSCLRLQGFARVPPGASTAPVYLPGWQLPSHSVIGAFRLALFFAQWPGSFRRWSLAFPRWCNVCIVLWMPLAPRSLISELYPLIRVYIYLQEQMVKTRKNIEEPR